MAVFKSDVTVIIPTIPPRRDMLQRAVQSVAKQTRPVCDLLTYVDTKGEGPAVQRNRMVDMVRTTWVAPLDDDDEFLPHHLEYLLRTAEESGADMIYPKWTGINTGLFPGKFDRPFDDELATSLRHANFIPVTTLIRTEALRAVGGFVNLNTHPAGATCEDWGAWLRMLDAGYTFAHCPHVTWKWNGHNGHTSGRSWKKLITDA